MTKVATYTQDHPILRDAFLVIGASLLISLIGQLSIPLPFTPVPITFRFQTILCLGFLLGPKRGVLSVLLFILQGLSGLSLFAPGGLIGPSGGYYVGFLIAAYGMGRFKESMPTFSVKKTSFAFLLASFVIYGFGAMHLAHFVGWQKALLLGVAPFVIPNLLQSVFCLKILEKFQTK